MELRKSAFKTGFYIKNILYYVLVKHIVIYLVKYIIYYVLVKQPNTSGRKLREKIQIILKLFF